MRLRRILVWTVVGLGLALPAVLAGLRTRPARDEIRKQVEVLAAEELNLKVEVGDIELQYFPPAAIVRNIRLTHPTEGILARAAYGRVTPRLWPLARGKLQVNEVTLEAAALRLVVRDGKIVNLPTLRTRPRSKSSGEMPLRGLSLSDTILIVESDGVAQGEVRGLDLDVSVEDGEVLEARLRAVSGVVRHARGDEPLRNLELRAALTKQHVILRRLDVALGDLRLKASDGLLRREEPLDAAVSFAVSLPLDVSARLGLNEPALTGGAAVAGRLRVRGEDIAAEGDLHLENPQIDQFKVGDAADLPFRVDRTGITIHSGVVHAAGGQARIPSARIAFDSLLTLDAEVTLHDIAFEQVLDNLTLPNSHCQIAVAGGGGRFHGTLSPFRIDSVGDTVVFGEPLRVTLEGFTVPERADVIRVPNAELRTRLRFDPSGVRFRQGRVTFGRSLLRVDAHLRLDGTFEVHGQTDRIDLGDVNPLASFDIGGRGSLRFDIAGVYSDPVITGHARVGAFRFHTFVFGDVDSDLRYQGEILKVTGARGVRGFSRFTVPSGQLDFRTPTLDASATVLGERMLLSEFYEIWHLETDPDFTTVQGQAHGAANVRLHAGILDVAYDAVLDRVTAFGERFQGGALRGSWRWIDRDAGWRGGDISFDELTLRKGQGTVSIDGGTRRGGLLYLLVVADRIALEDMDRLRPHLGGLRSVAGLHATVRGTLEALEIDGRASLSEARLRGSRLGASEARFSIRGPDVSVRGELAGGQLGFDLHARRTAGIPYSGRFDLRGLALGFVLERFGVPPEAGVEAIADGVINVDRGLLSAPERSEGRLTLERLHLAVGPYALDSDGPVRLSFARRGIAIEQARFVGRSTRFSLSGTASERAGYALRMRGEVDLEFLQSLYPELEAVRGTLSIDGHLAGQRGGPLLLGSASVRNASVKIPNYEQRLESVSGEITFSQTTLLFEGFEGRLGGGRVGMRGSVRFAGPDLDAYALQVDLRDVPLMLDEDGTTAVLDGSTQLRWGRGDRLPLLTGDLDLLRVRYEHDVQLVDLRRIRQRAERAEVEQYDPAQDHVALDLRLHGDDNLHVQNNLLEAEFRIDETVGPLRIVGTDQRFGMVGELAVTRGTLRFRSYDFDISRGTVTFDDRTKVDPRFDLSAETELREWRVRLQALGTADEFRIFTTSEPELPEEDIAFLLAFGVTRDEVADAESGAGQIYGQAALEALAAATGVDREVRRVVPIDDIRLGSSYSDQLNRTEPTLSIGKRVSNNVRVTATTGLGEERDVSANVEWRLNRNLSVEGAYDNNNQQSTLGNVGVDLRFRLEFE